MSHPTRAAKYRADALQLARDIADIANRHQRLCEDWKRLLADGGELPPPTPVDVIGAVTGVLRGLAGSNFGEWATVGHAIRNERTAPPTRNGKRRGPRIRV